MTEIWCYQWGNKIATVTSCRGVDARQKHRNSLIQTKIKRKNTRPKNANPNCYASRKLSTQLNLNQIKANPIQSHLCGRSTIVHCPIARKEKATDGQQKREAKELKEKKEKQKKSVTTKTVMQTPQCTASIRPVTLEGITDRVCRVCRGKNIRSFGHSPVQPVTCHKRVRRREREIWRMARAEAQSARECFQFFSILWSLHFYFFQNLVFNFFFLFELIESAASAAVERMHRKSTTITTPLSSLSHSAAAIPHSIEFHILKSKKTLKAQKILFGKLGVFCSALLWAKPKVHFIFCCCFCWCSSTQADRFWARHKSTHTQLNRIKRHVQHQHNTTRAEMMMKWRWVLDEVKERQTNKFD